MATVNYLYRSTKNEANLNIRLLFRADGKDFVLGAKTRLKVSREYWETTHNKRIRSIRDHGQKKLYNEVNEHLAALESHVLNRFGQAAPAAVDKEWLRSVVASYYSPSGDKPTDGIPTDLVGYIDFYLERKKNDISVMTERRTNVVKHKMERMQAYLGRTLYVKDVNEEFKREFQEYYKLERYSPNTRQREFKTLKSICYHAEYMGLDTHHQLKRLKLESEPVKHIYLTTEEIDRIKNVELPSEYLDNARDWLIISCYTGQRVSDFLRFKKRMLRPKGDNFLLEFKQKKTGKRMTIPILKEVAEILDKRGGEFPRSLSDQKYNDYLKDVAKAAGLNEICEGKRRVNIAPECGKAKYRDIVGEYPKWKLVSSHIGRRSFATNHYGNIPTSVLIGITGHSSEAQFLNYIQKSSEQAAIDALDYFN